MATSCSIADCGRNAHKGGLCSSHAKRLKRYGDPLAGAPIRPYSPRLPSTASLEDRLWAKAPMPSNPMDCWEWTGAVNVEGYGVIRGDGVNLYAHRASYELSMGTIGDGLQIDHLCRNRRCVNPLHLQAVTQSENNRRRPDRSVTHCPQGHPYSGDNLYEYNGRRICRTCKRQHGKAHRARVAA